MEMEASSKARGGKSPSRKHLLCKELAASVKGVSVKNIRYERARESARVCVFNINTL